MSCSVAILGGGPAGSTFAALLAQAGWRPVLFTDEKTPDLLVGESLIPAMIPLLRQLGVEERVAAISQHKPGVSFVHPRSTHDIDFIFDSVRRVLPAYAYNVPRPAFDQLLAERASELGVVKIRHRAEVEPDGHGGLRLTDHSLAAAPSLGGRQPDWLIDASGRRRLSARTLDIPAIEGPRRDVAYFAHYQGCHHPKAEGQVIITKLRSGWSWRIPLPQGRMSIGVVINQKDARTLGNSPETRLTAAIARDPYLAPATADAQRISAVKTYANYQLVSTQGFGRGWIQLGDAYGFVDPMLSPGLFLAMESAQLLAGTFIAASPAGPSEKALKNYSKRFGDWLNAWSELVEMFYDGRIFSLQEAGQQILRGHANPAARHLQRYLHTHIACMTAGAWTTRRYSRRLLRLAGRHLIWNVPPPREMAIV